MRSAVALEALYGAFRNLRNEWLLGDRRRVESKASIIHLDRGTLDGCSGSLNLYLSSQEAIDCHQVFGHTAANVDTFLTTIIIC